VAGQAEVSASEALLVRGNGGVRRRTDAAGHAEKRLPLAKVAAAAQRQWMPTWRPAPLETRPEGERGCSWERVSW
jgi:hypothetical protein